MKRFLSFVLRGVIALILFTVCLLAAAWYWSGEIVSSLRPTIETRLSALINGEVRFASLKARVLPTLSLVAEGVVFTPANSCGRVSADSLGLRLDPWALLGKIDLEIDSITLIRPRMALVSEGGKVTLAAGDGTACAPSSPQGTGATPQETEQKSEAVVEPESLPARAVKDALTIKLEAFEVRDAEVTLAGKKISHVFNVATLTTPAKLEPGVLTLVEPKIAASVDGIPVAIDGGNISAAFIDGTLSVAGLNLLINGERLRLGGHLSAAGFPLKARVETQKLSLPTVLNLAALVLPDAQVLQKGTFSGTIGFTKPESEGWQVKGSIALRDLALPNNVLAVGELRLDDFTLESKAGATTASAQLVLAQAGLTGKKSSGSFGRLSGPLSLSTKSGADFNVKGQLAADEFVYRGYGVNLEHVKADLKDIRAKISRRGDVSVNVALDGKALTLDHPKVRIFSVRKVAGPIAISIPRGPSYSISGPVTLEGVALETIGLSFSDLQSNVDMLISRPLQRYATKELKGKTMNRPISVATDFSITPEQLAWRETKLNLSGGTLGADCSLERGGKRAYAGTIKANNMPLAELLTAYRQSEEKGFSGVIKNFEAALGGSMLDTWGTLKGSGKLAFNDPVLKNYNLTEALGAAIAKIPVMGGALRPGSSDEDLKNASSEGEYTVAAKKVHFSKFIIRRSRYTVNGDGDIGFDKTIDLRAQAVFLKETFRAFGLGFDRLGNMIARAGKISIPVLLQGTINKPEILPDLKTFVADNSGISFIDSVLDSRLNPFRRSPKTKEK